MIKIIEPSFEILTPIDYLTIIKRLEMAGRTAYKSEDKITQDSAERFVGMIIKRGHESVLEHESISVRFIGDRTMSHQLVRHRISSFTQESQRYCNYNKSEELEVVCPPSIKNNYSAFSYWDHSTNCSYDSYKELIKIGVLPEDARSVLPGCCKTEIVTTMNMRQWRHFFHVRCDKHAQWQIRGLAIGILNEFKKLMPVIFEDLNY